MTTEPNPLPPPSLNDLERALDEAISALVAYRVAPPIGVLRAFKGKGTDFASYSASELLATPQEVLRARDLASAPVERGLKQAIRELGKLIHAHVGDEGLSDVAERVCGLDADNWSRRMSPVDSAWNGIGSWVS